MLIDYLLLQTGNHDIMEGHGKMNAEAVGGGASGEGERCEMWGALTGTSVVSLMLS
jgi:hypothetical protein